MELKSAYIGAVSRDSKTRSRGRMIISVFLLTGSL